MKFIIAVILMTVSFLGIQSANAQQKSPIVTIPPNMHECLTFVVTLHFGFAEGVAIGHQGNATNKIDDEVKAIEGCILHPERKGL